MKYKRFQIAAIKKIVNGYESNEKNNRFLVADEVGLGKTIIAKGAIRCLFYFEYLKQGCKPGFEYNVLYLCSNLNIAEQNKSKLGVSKRDKASLMDNVLLGDKSFGEYRGNHYDRGSSVENRTTMLLKKLLENASNEEEKKHFQEISVGALREACREIYGEQALKEREAAAGCETVDEKVMLRLNIIPITTKTSIEIKGGGHQLERDFIAETMKSLQNLAEMSDTAPKVEGAKKQLLLEFAGKLEDIKRRYPEIQNTDAFLHKLLKGDVKLADETEKKEWQKLRQLFALASVEMLKYDFVIMDEFQNFSEILHKANETETKKKNYIGKAGYIYTALKASGAHEALAKRLEEEYLCKTVAATGAVSVRLSEADAAFWKNTLAGVNIEENADIDELMECFTELAGKRLTWKVCEAPIGKAGAEYDKKVNMLRLVKAILNREDVQFVDTEYKRVSDDISFVSGRIESIELEDKSKYRKSVLEIYRDQALEKEKYGLLQWWEKETFQAWYQRLRDCGMIRWNGVPKKKVPFRYLLNLHYGTRGTAEDTSIPKLILNCFLYFAEDSWEKIYLWQYAYLLTNQLVDDSERMHYTVEQLEPLRELLGTYVKQADTLLDLDKKCENIVIEKIFSNEFQNGKYTKILMLSATPFRMYVTEGRDTENNANIMDVCDFLDTNAQTNLGGNLVSYKNELLQFAQGADSSIEDVTGKKEDFQKSMNRVFTRMERYAVLRELVEEWFVNQAEGRKDDELVCGKIRELFAYLKQAEEMDGAGSIISYAVDAPYMGTFMHGIVKEAGNGTGGAAKKEEADRSALTEDDGDGYKWKKSFDRRILEKEVPLREDSYLYLTRDAFDRKEKPLGLWHGVYEGALGKLLELEHIDKKMWEKQADVAKILQENHPGAARLLWVPSCVSKHKLESAFKEHSDYGKTIIFSRLVQVPRMLAGLTGYEVLRRLTWMIEEQCRQNGTDAGVFDRMLYCLGCEGMEEASTYQKLERILDKAEKKIEELLLLEDEPKSIKGICKEALERYCEKYQEKNCKKTCREEGKDQQLHLDKLLEKRQVYFTKLEILAGSLAKNLVHNVLLNRQQGMFAIWASEGFWNESRQGEACVLDDEELKQAFLEDCKVKVLQYCEHGCLAEVLDEWLYICLDGEQDLGEFLGVSADSGKVDCLSFIRATKLSVSLYEKDENGMVKSVGLSENKGELIDTFFARCIGMSKDDDKVSSIKGLQQSFNAPFAPFVFATTSMGQEGLDFHHYADKIIHWRLPANPVDFEQREGRINRYHCLALRKKLMEWYGAWETGQDTDVYEIFQRAFEKAEKTLLQEVENPIVNCGLVPDWVLLKPDKSESVSIKRYVPYFYLSKTNEDFHKNLKVLQLYRSVIGQTDPEEVMERLMTGRRIEEVAQLFVDFSPYNVEDK